MSALETEQQEFVAVRHWLHLGQNFSIGSVLRTAW